MVSVKKSETSNRISVKSTKETNVFSIKDNLSEYYAKQAEKWATSEDIVNGVDYSSKYYAEQSKAFWGDVEVVKNDVQNLVTGFDSKVEESLTNIENETFSTINNINTNKTNAISEINSTKTSAINAINTNKNTAINEINSAGKSYDNLTHKQITNCLLEVPQKIKLELNNGTLTLKAGSKVIVPNGAGVFNEVVVGENLTITGPTINGTGELLIYYDYTNSGLRGRFVTKSYSSSTNPNVTYSAWYDITNNKIYDINADTSSTNTLLSLPIAKVTADSNKVLVSIDQVFNGFGYIGSTIWVDKGVKGLIPNGRNADGSLKNIEVTTSKVSIHTLTSTNDRNVVLLASGNIDEPSGLVYSEAENRNYNFANIYNVCDCGTVKRNSNGVITSLDIKQPFRAVDYADYKPAIDNKVSKSGDTMTGTLSFNKTGTQILVQTDEFDQGVAVDSSKYCGIQFNDKNGNRFGKVEGHYLTDGTVKFGINAHRNVNGTACYASVSTWVDANGGLNCSFPMCTSKATTTSSATTSKVAVVVQNYVNGTSWYRVWSDGWKEQGGRSTTVEDGSKVISFTKNFSNTNYTLVIGTDYSASFTGNQQGPNVYYGNCTVSGFTAYHASHWITGNTEIPFRWYACGY